MAILIIAMLFFMFDSIPDALLGKGHAAEAGEFSCNIRQLFTLLCFALNRNKNVRLYNMLCARRKRESSMFKQMNVTSSAVHAGKVCVVW